MSHRTYPGPHELGQNLLVDRTVARRVATLVADRTGPILEWAAGRGALTKHLARLNRPLEAVELDPRSLNNLKRNAGRHVVVTRGDILLHRPPDEPHDLVCNVPFHITTAVLRRLLDLPQWRRAVLITQWEVARKRAAVGGATMMTAQSWPWFTFRLDRRIPARSFRPIPGVDAGILLIDRRETPLIPPDQKRAYDRLVATAFRSGGSSLRSALITAGVPRRRVGVWLARQSHPRPTRLGHLKAEQWVELFALSKKSGGGHGHGLGNGRSG